jgi:arginase
MPLLQFNGCIGDRTTQGRHGARSLASAIALRTQAPVISVGTDTAFIAQDYQSALKQGSADLSALSSQITAALDKPGPLVLTMGRCAAALGSLPAIVKAYPDAAILWLDAHGDLNTPDSSASGYLGGMVISGAAGLYGTGLPAGLALGNVMLVGARDLDPFEQQLIEIGDVAAALHGPGRLAAIDRFVGGRPVFVHLDVDVLEPGYVPTGFSVPGGLDLQELHELSSYVARGRYIGCEIAEMEGYWPDGSIPDLVPFLEAIAPLLAPLRRSS